MIRRLATQERIVYSKRTKSYLRDVRQVVEPKLPKDPEAMLQLLGWTVRMMRYEAARQRGRRGAR